MSDPELIAPLPLDEMDLSDDVSDEEEEEEVEEGEEVQSRSAGKEAPIAQKPALSAYLQGFSNYVSGLTPKKLKEAIKSIEVANPQVHQFAPGEKFFSVVKGGAGVVSARKLRAEWGSLRYKFLVEGKLGDNSSVLGYVTCGKKNELAHLPIGSPERFVLVPATNLAAFHPLSFDPSKHFEVTRQDQRSEMVTIDSPQASFRAINFDPRFILKAAKASGRAARPKAAKKPGASANDLGERICDASRKLIFELQSREALNDVSVLVEHSPLFKELRAYIGSERFPVLRSEDTDGLRLLPYDIAGDLGKMAECVKNLRAIHSGVQTEHVNGRWATEPLVRALLLQSMAKQSSTLPATRLLRDSGMALSESNISTFMGDLTDSDRGCAFIADAIVAMALARDIFNELLLLDHALLRTAAPLIAFANCAERLSGGLLAQEFLFDSERMGHAPTLRCALTGSTIVPGMPFYLLCAKTRPKEGQTAGRTMVAIVAKAVHDADMRLYPVR